jgi:hypothetical protein
MEEKTKLIDHRCEQSSLLRVDVLLLIGMKQYVVSNSILYIDLLFYLSSIPSTPN